MTDVVPMLCQVERTARFHLRIGRNDYANAPDSHTLGSKSWRCKHFVEKYPYRHERFARSRRSYCGGTPKLHDFVAFGTGSQPRRSDSRRWPNVAAIFQKRGIFPGIREIPEMSLEFPAHAKRPQFAVSGCAFRAASGVRLRKRNPANLFLATSRGDGNQFRENGARGETAERHLSCAA